MHGARVFIDANVFLYTITQGSGPKAVQAKDWLRLLSSTDRGQTNLQVLNEVTNVLLRKRPDLTPAQTFFEVDQLRPFGSSPIGDTSVDLARVLRTSTAYAWWDCLLLASAFELGCTYFLSEDMQDGQRIAISADDSLTLINPFAHSPDQILIQH